MNSEEKFKHILNAKLEVDEFSFDEANWDKAQALLNAQEKKKRRLFWFFLSSCSALLIGGVYLLLFNNVAPTTLTSDAIVNTSTTPALTNGINTVQKATAIAQQNKQKIAPIFKNKTTQTIANKASQLVEVTNKKNISTDNNTTKTAQQSETTAYVSTQATAAIKQQKGITKLSKQLAKQQKKNNNVNNNISESPVNSIKNERFTSIENTNDNKNNTTKETLHNASTINDATTNATVVSTNTIINTNELTPSTIVIADSATTTNKPNELATTTVNTSTQTTIDTTKKIPEESAKQIKHNYISLEAGANYTLGWKTNNIKEGYGINPIVGINYIYTITKNIVLAIGAQYNALTHFKASTDTSTNTNYSFGVQKNETVTLPKKLNYIVAPIKIYYALTPNNSIGAGFNVAYLLRTNATQTTYTNTNGVLSKSTPTKANNYPNGFNTYDVQLALCYKRKLISKLYLNTEFYYGLLDVKNNTFYNSATTQRNAGIKLTLNYNLIQL
ncbi:MAG: hypothetical protein ABL940_05830 [Bacteroidia bacterium]